MKIKKSLNDSFLLAAIGGLAGAVAMEMTNYMFFRKGKSEHLYGHLAGSMIMRSFRTNRRKNFILGEMFHLFWGSFLGIAQVEVLKRYGQDYHLLKGGGTGLITWGILYNFGQRMKFFSRRAHLTKTHYKSIINHLVYGFISSHLIVYLADPALFRKNRSLSSEKQDFPAFTEQNNETNYVGTVLH